MPRYLKRHRGPDREDHIQRDACFERKYTTLGAKAVLTAQLYR